MQKLTAIKIVALVSLMILGTLASVMYALAYSEKREIVYTGSIKIESQEVKFRAFYLSAPAGLFEVKLSVSRGPIKWTPHSAVMFEDTLGWFPMSNKWEIVWDNPEVDLRNRQRNRQLECGPRKREHGLVPQLLQSGLV